jgi:hypothetical protein
VTLLKQTNPYCHKYEVLLEVRIQFSQTYFTSEVVLQENKAVPHKTYKVKFTLEQATKAQRGRRGIALIFP